MLPMGRSVRTGESMTAYDPMTLLTPESAALLTEWLTVSESRSPLVLRNETPSGGALQIVRDKDGVWITPIP